MKNSFKSELSSWFFSIWVLW